ncbi:MAG TPA: BON domain-containing protein [Candidatus Angelobacter sp.]|jgi:osmotically-inducible protein OsmY
MSRILFCTLLLLSTPVIGQQPQDVDPMAPNAQQVSPENTSQMNQSAPPLENKTAGNEHIKNNLQSAFDDDPSLSGAEVATSVDDERITLTGTVQSYLQHQRVLQLVSVYSSYREIVDKVTVQ